MSMRLIDADLLGLTDMEIILCDGDYKEALKMLINKIEHAPTVDPQPKTGKWKKMQSMFGVGLIPVCSECEYVPLNREKSKFCPNCGCRMLKEGEEE